MGIRKKVVLGLILIGFLLAMSGILSSIELAKLNKNTAREIKSNEESLILSKKLLDAVQQKNTALLHSLEDTLDVYDSIIYVSDSEFDKTLLLLKSQNRNPGLILRIEAANSRYNKILAERNAKPSFKWFVDVYSSSYMRVTTSVKEYMISEQDAFQKYTSVLEANVYRALMVGIISFAAAILLLAAFYYMIHSFFLSPVLKMERSLRDFLKANIPYSVKVDTNDEIHELSEYINEVCSRARRNVDDL